MRLLIVNADDLGYDPEIDRGILEGHRRGIVTSATAMVATPFSEATLASAPETLGLGLHAVLDPGLGRQAAEEVLAAQIERFQRLRGSPPTHVDTHKHVHANPALLEAVAAVALANGLAVRAIDTAMRSVLRQLGIRTTDHFLGDATMRPCWTADRLAAAIAALANGATEVMCHPGHAPSHVHTSFSAEREAELAAVCDARVREALRSSGVRLGHYGDL